MGKDARSRLWEKAGPRVRLRAFIFLQVLWHATAQLLYHYLGAQQTAAGQNSNEK
jgi:hypothetical protein